MQNASTQPVDDAAAIRGPVSATVRFGVPFMLFISSIIMALAWLGHLRFKDLPFHWAIAAAWLIVLPEYILNIGAIRLGYGTYTGGNMAAFNLCTGVVCVALVSRFVLDEPFTAQKLAGFALMGVAMLLVATGNNESEDV
jgi:hypothetical protein